MSAHLGTLYLAVAAVAAVTAVASAATVAPTVPAAPTAAATAAIAPTALTVPAASTAATAAAAAMVAGSPTPLHIRHVIWELHKYGAITSEIVAQLERYGVKRRTVQRIVQAGREAEEMGLDVDTALKAIPKTGRPSLLDSDRTAALLAAVDNDPGTTIIEHARNFGVHPDTISRILAANDVVVMPQPPAKKPRTSL